jgi:hypothetical protein
MGLPASSLRRDPFLVHSQVSSGSTRQGYCRHGVGAVNAPPNEPSAGGHVRACTIGHLWGIFEAPLESTILQERLKK